nr:cyclophilin-like fold protein [Enterocloster clostridioformis]
MTVNGQDIEVLLYDTPAANSLYEMLPLELTFEDYNGTEKISYLPEHLTTDGEPDSFDPDTGDFCLYEPWGNLSIFYQDFQNSSGLISLGRIEEGMDVISAMEGDFVVLLTKTED